MNYLVLTPDGVGSTYLQRALTVHLNAAGLDYYNIHELLNGLELQDSRVSKNFDLEYSQSLDEIKSILEKNTASIISRLSDYYVYDRLDKKVTADSEQDYKDFYKFCNEYHGKVFYCARDPFEYALSWSIRKISKAYNVYNVDRRIEVHNLDKQYNIDSDYFNSKLNQYNDYISWVEENFPNAIRVNYNDLNFNVDAVVEELTGVKSTVLENFDVSIGQYSKLLYSISLKEQKLENTDSINEYYSRIKNLQQYIEDLMNQDKLVTAMPIKMNTLAEKQQKVTNFENFMLRYNNWASLNNYAKIDKDIIAEKIKKEQAIYENVFVFDTCSLLEFNKSMMLQQKQKVRVV
jgi:hypothetical protein